MIILLDFVTFDLTSVYFVDSKTPMKQSLPGDGLDPPSLLYSDNSYHGHLAECPKAPLTCPNSCGSKEIK